MKAKHLTAISDLTTEDIEEVFEWTVRLKQRIALGIKEHTLTGKVVALIFEKASMRTRVSFEVAVHQLGGTSIYLSDQNIGLGTRESIKDVGRVMSRYVHGIVIRTFQQSKVTELANYSTVPVINGLSDYMHPCQALADLFTVREKLGTLRGVRLAFVGDGNNVARSLAMLCARLGVKYTIATPPAYALDGPFVELLKSTPKVKGFAFRQMRDPKKAVRNADVIYTDTWTSMGQEAEAAKRRKAFAAYQVNQELLKEAGKDVLVMHCLPAHRGEEITDEVIDGPASIVVDQAENRLHVQRAILRLLIGPPTGQAGSLGE
jgi:ornithine carbamoyltransferase